MVEALKRYIKKTLERVERTFLSAHIHETGTSESCIGAEMIDSRYVQGRPAGRPAIRRPWAPFFYLHSGRRTLKKADRNVCPTFTRDSQRKFHAAKRACHFC